MIMLLMTGNEAVVSQGAFRIGVGVGVGGSSALVPGVYGSFSPGTGGGGAGVTEVFSYAPT